MLNIHEHTVKQLDVDYLNVNSEFSILANTLTNLSQ